MGGSPGLVVMGKDSRSKGRGFESRYRGLDGHFFTYICCKNCNVCLKRLKINEKEAGVGPFFKKYSNRFPIVSSYLLHTSCPRYSLVVFATEPVHSVPNTYHQPQNINLNLKLMHVAWKFCHFLFFAAAVEKRFYNIGPVPRWFFAQESFVQIHSLKLR